jgi:hypothetical protein
MVRVFLVLACFFLAFQIGLAARFELAVATTTSGGFRATTTTTYSFFEIGAGTKTLRWRRTDHFAYLNHWISPSGRVWIMVESPKSGFADETKSPRRTSSISLRSLNGDVLATWSGWGEPGPLTIAANAPGISPVVAAKVVAKLLRPDAEQLVVPHQSGAETHLTLFWPKGHGKPFGFRQSFDPRKSMPPLLLEQALSNPAYGAPTYDNPFGQEMTPTLWRAKALDNQHKDLVWLVPSTGSLGYTMGYPGVEQRLAQMPDSLQAIPGGLLLEFDFLAKAATMTVRDHNCKVIRTTDLLKLGGFSNVSEAKTNLKWRSPMVQTQHGWAPVSEVGDLYGYGTEQVELWDTKGRRFLLDLKPGTSGSNKVLSGFAARRPKDPYTGGGWTKVSERTAVSPNGRFKLRLRSFSSKSGMNPKSMTLLALVPERGKTAEVELWNTTTYEDVPFMTVTNNGRAISFQVERMKIRSGVETGDHMQDFAQMRVFSPDGNGIEGIDPLHGWDLKTIRDVRDRVRFNQIKTESLGKPEVVQTDGIAIQVYPVERLTIPVKGAPTKIYYILRRTPMGDNMVVQDQPWVQSMVQQAISH